MKPLKYHLTITYNIMSAMYKEVGRWERGGEGKGGEWVG